MEEGDGELLIPAVLQPVATLGGPLFSMTGDATSAPGQSQVATANSFVSGVAVAHSTLSPFFKAGTWLIDVRWRWHFTGTTDVAKNMAIDLVDPDGIFKQMFRSGFFNGAQAHGSTQLTLSFIRDDWYLEARRSATIAGDVADLSVTFSMIKLG